jgi:hypothetical protein
MTKDLNDEGGSILVLDTATEEILGLVAQKITNVEQELRKVSYEMDQNRIAHNNKLNKKLKSKKKKLMSRKSALEKE